VAILPFASADCEGLITSEFFVDLRHLEETASVASSEESASSQPERPVSMAEFVSRGRSQEKNPNN
jgi:hypothetical protein